MVQAFSHDVIIPRDPQSGPANRSARYKPVVITKGLRRLRPLPELL
nr:hypothetical protein [Pseudomonas baetica]